MKCIQFLYLIYFLPAFINGSTNLEDIDVALELFNMDLEDKCNELAVVQNQMILNQTNAVANKIEIEKDIGHFIRDETKRLRDTHDISSLLLSEPKQRQWTIAMKMGDVELPLDNWNELVYFKNSNEELSTNLQILCLNKTEKCTLSKTDVTKILAISRDAKELQSIWTASQEIYPKNNTEQFLEVLKLVQKAADSNDEEDAQHYWETLVEYPKAYETAKALWSEIEPLYIKFHSFVKKRLEQYYSEVGNSTSIPVYLLGSEFGTDWSNIAPLVLPHRYLYDEITSMLDFDNIGGKKVYEIAEKFTTSMGFGKAGSEFWKNSIFNHKCPSQLLTFCGDKYTSVITCNATGWLEYLDAHEDMVRVTLNNRDYAVAASNSYRISALDEALAGLSSILALKNLPQAGVVPESLFMGDDDNQNQNAAMMLTALRVLPRLPYYLLADLWRLQQLNGEDTEQPAASWWTLRESIQRVTGVSNIEPDFLGDSYIHSNKPYIGKFLGTILQFEILEYFDTELTDGVNILTHMSSDEAFSNMLKERGLNSWHDAVSNNLYYDIASNALLDYFKPLEEYMNEAPVEQITQTVIPKTTTTTTTTTTTPKPTTTDASVSTLPRDEPLRNKSQNIRLTSKLSPIKVESSPPKSSVTSTSSPKATVPPATGNVAATWAGALIGVGALLVIVVAVGRNRCRRKPLPHNRRNEV